MNPVLRHSGLDAPPSSGEIQRSTLLNPQPSSLQSDTILGPPPNYSTIDESWPRWSWYFWAFMYYSLTQQENNQK